MILQHLLLRGRQNFHQHALEPLRIEKALRPLVRHAVEHCASSGAYGETGSILSVVFQSGIYGCLSFGEVHPRQKKANPVLHELARALCTLTGRRGQVPALLGLGESHKCSLIC
jgi:hypothetical protein